MLAFMTAACQDRRLHTHICITYLWTNTHTCTHTHTHTGVDGSRSLQSVNAGEQLRASEERGNPTTSPVTGGETARGRAETSPQSYSTQRSHTAHNNNLQSRGPGAYMDFKKLKKNISFRGFALILLTSANLARELSAARRGGTGRKRLMGPSRWSLARVPSCV